MKQKIIFKKLVRDNMPGIIKSLGKEPVFHSLNETEYAQALVDKLQEEVSEFIQEKTIKELADIIEVVYALAALKNVSPEDLEIVRREKANQRGAFSQKVYLDHVLE